MSKQRNSHNNWDAFTTTKTFDYGPKITDQEATEPIEHQMEMVSSTVTTPISLLVQSLVLQLCALLERDETRATHLYNSICEKLHQMKLIDETYSMGEFEVMRSQYQRALYQLVSVASGIETALTLPTSWPLLEPSAVEWSRYHREFEEIFFISSGGFGSVFKAKHRLDGMEYAIKKICIRSSNINTVMNHLAEVKTLASLNHTNIVSYKAAWLEPLIEMETKLSNKGIGMDTDTCDSDLEGKYNSYREEVSSSKSVDSESFIKSKDHSDFIISFKSTSSSIKSKKDFENESSLLKDNCKIICKVGSQNHEKIPAKCSRVNLKWATLYIQMSLCQKTLKQWLQERNDSVHHNVFNDLSVSTGSSLNQNNFEQFPAPIKINKCTQLDSSHIHTIVAMFSQLVDGLHYIHAKGIVHHDIKPSNIFVGTEGNKVHIQLGDFGLACPLQQSHEGVALGTHLYAAPEQLEGECNPKSDMYSLGIVLLEMTETFHTDMERAITIGDLKKGKIPASLTANYPKIAYIIGKLTQRKASRRLDTSQLLIELTLLNDDKDGVIRNLREELATKDDEIAKLKILLANCNNGL